MSNPDRRFVVRLYSISLLEFSRNSQVKRHQSLDSQLAIRMLSERKANDSRKIRDTSMHRRVRAVTLRPSWPNAAYKTPRRRCSSCLSRLFSEESIVCQFSYRSHISVDWARMVRWNMYQNEPLKGQRKKFWCNVRHVISCTKARGHDAKSY